MSRVLGVGQMARTYAGFLTCPVPEIARLGKTLKQWRDAFLGYFDTGDASNGGAEVVNGLIELQRGIARGFRNRDNYRCACSSSPASATHLHRKCEEPVFTIQTAAE